MKKLFLIFLSAALFCHAGAQEQWSTEYAYYGRGGSMTYMPDEEGNIIPDFSHVGYRYGDETIPDVAVVVEVSPVDGDDGAVIQAAIESLYSLTPDENGFRGAVLLKAGTYEVENQIIINKSGIVLKGEGQDENGTIVLATGTDDRVLLEIGTGASINTESASVVSISEDFVPLGRKFVIVNDASGYTAGDDIALYRPGTSAWISDLKMDQISNDDDGTPSVQWSASSYSFYFERKVTRVNGDTIFFRNPVVMSFDKKYGGGKVYKSSFSRLENVGIENICFTSEYTSETDESHSWSAIQFNNVENGWVRNVSSWYFAFACVAVEADARLISVLNSSCYEPKSIITGGRRYSFYCVGQMNLFKGCHTTEGRHDYVTSSRVCGPNVFTQCTAEQTYADIGPHHRWAMGTLYDQIKTDGEINVQDRDNMGSGHGWAGANQVFWNCKGSASICQSPWVSAKNYNFGFQGDKLPGFRNDRPQGVWVGHNRPGIFPASLYEAQLDQRLNNTIVFSANSELESLDDSTFRMEFNLPLKEETVLASNFTIGGTAAIEDLAFSVEKEDAFHVIIHFPELGILQAFSTITVEAHGVLSSDELYLNGIATSIYTEPDKRPIVSGPNMDASNEPGSFVVAKSSKPGFIYLVRIGEPIASIQDFEDAVANHKGVKTEVSSADVSVPIYTEGIYGGVYYVFSVDTDGRISAPGSQVILIEEVIPVSSQQIKNTSGFRIWTMNQSLIISPDDSMEKYRIDVFDMSGRMLVSTHLLSGEHKLQLDSGVGILLVKISSGDGITTRKIGLLE